LIHVKLAAGLSLTRINIGIRGDRKMPSTDAIGAPAFPRRIAMNQLTRWSPFRQIARLDPFNELEDAFRGWFPRENRQFERAMDMRVDVSETDKGYAVAVDLPGVRKDDIDVAVEGAQVTIRAEVKRDSSSQHGKEIHSERFSGEAYRSLSLPQEIDAAGAKAHYDGGVLTLTLPKKNGASARHLTVG
jgi:HSP20 family protein